MKPITPSPSDDGPDDNNSGVESNNAEAMSSQEEEEPEEEEAAAGGDANKNPAALNNNNAESSVPLPARHGKHNNVFPDDAGDCSASGEAYADATTDGDNYAPADGAARAATNDDDDRSDEGTAAVGPGAYRIAVAGGGNNGGGDDRRDGRVAPLPGPPDPGGVIDAESQRYVPGPVGDARMTNLAVTAEAYAVEGGASSSRGEGPGPPPPEAKVIPTIYGVEKKRAYQIAGAVLLGFTFILGTVLGVLIPKIDNGNDADAAAVDNNNGIMTGEEESASQARAAKREVLAKTLAPLAGEAVFDPTSPYSSPHRIAALEWLVDDIIGNHDDRDNNNNSNNISPPPPPSWKIRQRYISALLYHATSGPHWHERLHFLTSRDECEWSKFVYNPDSSYGQTFIPLFNLPKGLACDAEGKMGRIELSSNNLVGTLPGEIAYLEEVAFVKFGTNSLGSTIPSEMGSMMPKLSTLILRENCLSGTVPESLFRLENLSVVELHGNNDLGGSLNRLCNGREYVRPITMSLLADCDSCGGSTTSLIECDCCNCCDSRTFDCCDKKGTVIFNYAWGDTFNRGECSLNDDQRLWQEDNCPCTVGEPPRCTTECNDPLE